MQRFKPMFRCIIFGNSDVCSPTFHLTVTPTSFIPALPVQMKDIVIFDLDGTLADGTHTTPSPKDNSNETWAWKPFNMACKDDVD